MNRIYIERPDDRDSVVTVLARNGYTVRIGRQKAKNGSRYEWFVEYWREGKTA